MRQELFSPDFRSPTVPKILVLVSLAISVFSVALLFWGAVDVGVTWDERIHALMLSQYFSSGWYASPDWLIDGSPDAFLGKWPYYVYAPVAALVGHLFAVVAGVEPWGGFSDSASAYAARHLAAGFMAALGIGLVALIVRTITRSWRWGVVAAALLASIPMWMGHGMFNGKDLPVGTGYTAATLGLVLMLTKGYSSVRRTRIFAIASLAFGLVLAVGTRPASGLPIVLTGGLFLVGFGVYSLARRRSPAQLPQLSERSLDLIVGYIAGYLLLVLIYPRGFWNPVTLVKESLLISGRFPVNDSVLTNGVWLSQPPPWFYLPTWFGFQLPLLILAASTLFILLWAFSVIRVTFLRSGNGVADSLVVVPVLLQALLLPMLAIAAQSTMYNAARQFLFVVPAMAVLATLGIRALVSALRSPWRVAVWVGVGVGLVLPVLDSTRLFPYSYVYFNELASIQGVNGNWATDYWRASSQEVARLIPHEGPAVCRMPSPGSEPSNCGDESPYVPFWNQRGFDAKPGSLGADEFWYARENNGDISVPDGCALHDALTRPLRGEDLVVAQVFRCGPEAP